MTLKRDKLPLTEIMQYERKGGWGRSIRGAEKAVAKLLSKDDTKNYAIELSLHLDLVACARMLQPANLASCLGDRLKPALETLQKAKVQLHTTTQVNLARKAAEKLCSDLRQRGAQDVNLAAMALYDIISPWPVGPTESASFDSVRPQLGAVVSGSQTVKTRVFTNFIIKSFVVPLLVDKNPKVDLIKCVMTTFVKRMQSLDVLKLNDNDAQVVADFEEITHAIVGLVGSPHDFLDHKEEVLALRDAIGTEGGGMLTAVANAAKSSTYFSDKLQKLVDAMDSLAEVRPLATKAVEDLSQDSNLAAALAAGSCLITKYDELVPSEALHALKELVQTKANQFYKDAVAANEDSRSMTDAEVQAGSQALHEVCLAFPMDEWANNLQAQFGALTRGVAAKSFGQAMLAATRQLAVSLDANSERPPAGDLDKLTEILNQAHEKVHFQDKEQQGAIHRCFLSALKFEHVRISAEWRPLYATMGELGVFWNDQNRGGDVGKRLTLATKGSELLVHTAAVALWTDSLPKAWVPKAAEMLLAGERFRQAYVDAGVMEYCSDDDKSKPKKMRVVGDHPWQQTIAKIEREFSVTYDKLVEKAARWVN